LFVFVRWRQKTILVLCLFLYTVSSMPGPEAWSHGAMGERRKVNGRTAFLALKEEIATELATGLYANAVHAKFEARLGFGYRQFLKYLKRYRFADAATSPPLPSVLATPSGRKPINAKPDAPRRFVFNPADIDAKKLI
jgi:hypothetical protein